MAPAHDKKDVVITGIGVVSPIGTGKKHFREALQAGKSGIDSITLFDASRFPTRFAGEAEGFDPGKLLAGTDIVGRTGDRRILLACGAARLAVEDAGLSAPALASGRSAVVMGSGVHPVIPSMEQVMAEGIYADLFHDPDPDPHKYAQSIQREGSGECPHYPVFNRVNGGMMAIAQQYGITGPSATVVSACAAATQAIGHAYRLVQRGEADIVLGGGYDSMIFNFGVYAFCLLGLMSTRNECPQNAMKPFDKDRDGFALGEGAGVVVVESRDSARKRGASIYATIAGYGASVDAYKVTDPHPEGRGAITSMQSALSDARMRADQIDYINAHGTATQKNDRIETQAIKMVFKDHAASIPVSSTKSMIGHLMAAGGALELIATVLGMEHGFIPPTINYQTPDAECDLDYVPNTARPAVVRAALSNSFGLGGQNASIIVRRDI